MLQPRHETGPTTRRRLRAGVAGLVALLALPVAALAQSGPPAYSAEALYRTPDGAESTGRVVKSGPDMRLEFVQNGQPVVQIIRRAAGLMYVLDPTTQSWFEVQGAPDPNAADQGYAPPCEQDTPGMVCRFIGNETTSGITAEVWEIGQQGQPQASRILWDGARHRALRQEYPDGTVMALAFKEMSQVSGRAAEHWTISLSVPGQPMASGHWYYDPELRVELREELPSGELRSLENIAVGAVDPTLFEVPAGWTKISPPQAPGAAAPN